MTDNIMHKDSMFTFLGEFLSPESERNFQIFKWQSTMRRLQSICFISAIAYLSAIIVDYLENNMDFTPQFWVIATMRFGIFIAGIALALFIRSRKNYCDLTYILAAYMLLFSIAESTSVVVDVSAGHPVIGSVFYVDIVLLYYLFLPPRVITSIISGVAGSVIYFFTMLLSGASVLTLFPIVVFLLVANGFGCFFAVNFGRTQRNESKALEEERRLNSQLQQAKGELERYYRLFSDNTIDIFYLYRLNSPAGFLYVSPSIFRLTGYKPDHFSGLKQVLRIVHTEDRAVLRRILKASPVPDGVAQLRIVNRDQSPVWIEHRYSTVDRAESNIVEGIVRNVTKRVLLEQDIARLDRLNVAGQMAASLAHEIRNPLATVRGYLQYFSVKNQFSPYTQQIKLMIDELDRTNSIISEYLALSKNKAIEFKKHCLNDIIHSLHPLLQTQSAATNVDIDLDLAEIPDLLLDEKEIKQLVLNFTRNAIEAMPKGGRVEIKTAVYGEEVELSFKDQGKGIPADIMQNLGKPFLTTKDFGTGLGMAICYQIINRHHAAIEINSGHEGTNIKVKFPVA